eukprot:4510741-Pyramimonas_sp.AAC.1
MVPPVAVREAFEDRQSLHSGLPAQEHPRGVGFPLERISWGGVPIETLCSQASRPTPSRTSET